MIISGRSLKEKLVDILKTKWIIINYDIIDHQKDWIIELIEKGKIKNIILDEAHYIKGKSNRAKATLEITEKADRVYCLTGTPLMNRPIELWNLLVAIKHPLTLGKGSRTKFSKIFCGGYLKTIPPTKWRPYPIRFWDESGATNLSLLRTNLKGHMIRRKKIDVLDLPAKMIDVVEVQMDNKQMREYESIWDIYLNFINADKKTIEKEFEEEALVKAETLADLNEAFEDHKNSKVSIENKLMARQLIEIGKLKQFCSGIKIKKIVEDTNNAIEQGEKVIIFTQYVKTLEDISKELRKSVKVSVLSGSTKQKDRQKAVDDFQNDDDVKVFVANIKAGGVGITLTKASIVMFADLDWTPEIHSQAEDRAHRIGQNRMVNVYYYVVQDTIEMDIIELLDKKKQMVNEVIDGTKDRVQSKNVLTEFIKRMSERSKD